MDVENKPLNWDAFKGPYPKLVYRYRPSDTAYFADELSATVDRQEFRFSPVKQLNDPFEYRPNYKPNSILEVRRYLADFEGRFGKGIAPNGTDLSASAKRNGLDPKLSSQLTGDKVSAAKWCLQMAPKVLEKYLDLSFSVSFSLRWDSLLMWSHYCNSHRGVCIEYQTDIDLMKESRHGLEPMIYQQERPTITTVDLLKYEGLKLAEAAPDFFDLSELANICCRMVGVKSRDWEYENEWRLSEFELPEAKYVQVAALSVKSIMIGSRIPKDVRSMIFENYYRKIPINEVTLDSKKYSLIRKEVHS